MEPTAEEKIKWLKKRVPDAFALVSNFFEKEPDKALAWFYTEKPNLGGVSPVQMIIIGRADKLTNWVKNAIDGNFP
jgi:hypothetical protein